MEVSRDLLATVFDSLSNLLDSYRCDCEDGEDAACDVCKGHKALAALGEAMDKVTTSYSHIWVLTDGMGNRMVLTAVERDGVTAYRLSSDQPHGTPLAISNLQMQKRLPQIRGRDSANAWTAKISRAVRSSRVACIMCEEG